ncbi:interleukin-1 family member A isoform X1 [Oryzias melastigma]|uniref:interleukin-1 family member A isoform X1 n=1 Tax=Oryzias melastigma TaxID=30732 RepID=UPI000CF7F8B6|nr:interleukin-1 family member A isoform X1 [Oryzias melastigma]
MDLKESVIDGGVFISHHLCDGKHQYKVEKVVNAMKNEKKMFVRTGDHLIGMDGISLDNFTPEDLARSLSEGNISKLTVQKTTRQKDQIEEEPPQGAIFDSEEFTVMSFSWKMKREKELEQHQNIKNEVNKGVETSDLLVIKMRKTTVSVMIGRGCPSKSKGMDIPRTSCAVEEIVLVAESSNVTLAPHNPKLIQQKWRAIFELFRRIDLDHMPAQMRKMKMYMDLYVDKWMHWNGTDEGDCGSSTLLLPRGDGMFRLEKLSEVFIEHKPSHRYLKRICSKTGLYTSPNPEKVTIYYYKSNIMEKTYRGMPVALNFTNSNCFLKCCKEGEDVVLQIETYEKSSLRQISKSDDNALAFVFYMKADRTKLRKFESALYEGWFICVQESTKAEVEPLNDMREEMFLFIIQK